jgi:hypothetical protein
MAAGSSCRSSQGLPTHQRRRPPWAIVALLLAGLLAGCGGGGKEHAKTAPSRTSTSHGTATQTERTETATAPAGQTGTGTSPEAQQGGAGDEEPARSQALFTGRGGHVTPRVVRVSAYIAIRIELRSGDGGTYDLRFGGRRLRVDRGVHSRCADFAGLRPGKALKGEPVGGGNEVRVEATAEPGP